MSFIYFDVKQGTEDWWLLRKGIPTGSRFDMILTPAKGLPSASQKKFIAELIGEIMSEMPPEGVENFTNRATRWGEECEIHARRWYSLQTGREVFNGGFCMTEDERFGCSPDFIVGLDLSNATEFVRMIDGQRFVGMKGATCAHTGEVKCPQSHTHTEYLLEGTLPNDHKCQCHGHMVVTGCDATDFLSYSPGIPELLVEVNRDAFTAKLAAALEPFYADFQAALKRIQGAEHHAVASWRALLTDDLSLASLNANLPTLTALDHATKTECWHLIQAFADRMGATFDKDRKEFHFALKDQP